MSRRIVLLSVLCSLLLATEGCVISFASVRGSGDLVTVEKDFRDFESLRLSHGCRVNLSQGSHSVVVRIDENLRQYLQVESDGSTLRIGMQRNQNYRNLHCEADVAMPDLRELRLSGGSRGYLEDFRSSNNVSMSLSGGSRVEGLIEAGRLRLGTSGGAQAELRGLVESLELDGSGGSQMRLGELKAGPVDVNLSGGSRCSVNLDGRLTGSLSGGASVQYTGEPTEIRVSKSGGARVSRR